jgi:uncharacterized membrane protein
MSIANPGSTMRIFRQPIDPMLVPIPIACFVGVLLTDLTYRWSADMMWANFSAWLVTVGVIVGLIAAVFGLIDFLGSRLIRALPPAWPHAIGNVVLLILATLNMFVHSRDACAARRRKPRSPPAITPPGFAARFRRERGARYSH